MNVSTTPRSDRGSVLPLVLVITTVLAIVVMATASYATTTLKYNQVVESRSGNLAAAHGAMDDALEQLRLRRSLCTTSSGASGVTTVFPETINGATATVTCRVVGGNVPPSDGWAIVVTGQGPVPAGLRFTLGGNPSIGGPVYVPSLSDVSMSQVTTIVEGDLWYQDNVCAGLAASGGLAYSRSDATVGNLVFDPAMRGIYCVNRSWNELFASTPPANVPTGPNNPPYTNYPGCRVFEPGVYTSPPVLANNNYFRSGNYHFANLGKIEFKQEAVTMGQFTDLPGFPATDNAACDNVRLNDEATGATLYVSGNTSFEMGPNSSFEVSRRQQGQYWVGVHVLPGSTPSGTYLMSADPGAKKELAIQGLLWAPNSSIRFGTVPAQKAAVLRGGAVVGSFEGGVSAAAIGFVIEIPTTQISTTLLLESTASNGEGSFTVRVVADYRPSNGDLAVNSWRVFQ